MEGKGYVAPHQGISHMRCGKAFDKVARLWHVTGEFDQNN